MHYSNFWIYFLALQVYVEGVLQINECSEGRVDINENDYQSSFSCSGYDEQYAVEWRFLGSGGGAQRTQLTCPLNNLQCDASPVVGASALRDHPTKGTTTLTITSNHRALLGNGMLQCFGYVSGASSYTNCNTNVISPAVISKCNVSFDSQTWIVSGICHFADAYSSNETYGCSWTQRLVLGGTQEIQGVLNKTSYIKTNKVYYKGNCSFATMATKAEGVLSYSMQFYPATEIKTVNRSILIDKPGPPITNCSDVIPEGDDFSCNCSRNPVNGLTGSPPPTYFQWDGFPAGPTLTLSNVTRQLHGKVYTCRQFWGPPADYDVTTVNFTLNVAFIPTPSSSQSPITTTSKASDITYPSSPTTSSPGTTVGTIGNSKSESQNGVPVAAIAGGVSAAVVAVIIVVVVVVVMKRRKNTPKDEERPIPNTTSETTEDDDTEEHVNPIYQSSDDVVEPTSSPPPQQQQHHQQPSNKLTAVTKPYRSEPEDDPKPNIAAVVNNPTTDENDNKNDENDDENGDENDVDIDEEQLDIGYSAVSFKKQSREATANRDSPNGADSLPLNNGENAENGNRQSNYAFGIDNYTSAEDSAGYAAVGGSSAGRKSQGLSSGSSSDVDPYYSTVRNSRAGETDTRNIDHSSSARGSSLYTDVDPYTQVDGDYSEIEDKANRNVSTTSNSTARPVSTEIDAGDYVSIDAAARTSGNIGGNTSSAKPAAPSSNGNSANRSEGQTRPKVSSTGKTDSAGYQSVGEAANTDTQAHAVGPDGDEYAVINKPTTTAAGKAEDISEPISPQHDNEEHVVGPEGDEYAVVSKPNKPSTTTDGKNETMSAPIPPQHDNEEYAVVNKKPDHDPNNIQHDPNNIQHDPNNIQHDPNNIQHDPNNIQHDANAPHQTTPELAGLEASSNPNHKPKPAVKPKPELKPKPSH